MLQQSQLWPNLTVAETHRLFAGYYEHPRDVDEVITLVGLAEKRDARVKTLSGGQKRLLTSASLSSAILISFSSTSPRRDSILQRDAQHGK